MNRQEQSQRRIEIGQRKRGVDKTVPFLIRYAVKRKIPVLNILFPSPNAFCFLSGAFLVLEHINIGKGSLGLVAQCVHCDRRAIHGLLANNVHTLAPGGIDGCFCRSGMAGLVPLPFLLEESPCILTSDEQTTELVDKEGNNISKHLLSTVKLIKTLKRHSEDPQQRIHEPDEPPAFTINAQPAFANEPPALRERVVPNLWAAIPETQIDMPTAFANAQPEREDTGTATTITFTPKWGEGTTNA